MKLLENFGKRELLLASAIFAFTAAIIVYKVHFLGYTMATIQPEKGYFVKLMMEVEGNGRDTYVDVTLPIQTERQRILKEQQSSDQFRYSITKGREARWFAKNLTGKHNISYSFFAQPEPRTYPIPHGTPIPEADPILYGKWLKATDRIQSDHAEIRNKALELMPGGVSLEEAVQATYNFVYQKVSYKKVRGPTDALTAARLREASCNGKNRLLVALFRARGIPARMSKGLVLQNTRKRTTHAWTEVMVDDQWVPVCPTNGHFAQLPENYLELAKGDQAAFTHPKGIGFDWKWVVQPQLNHQDQAVWSSVSNNLNILKYWVSLKDFHISLNLIMVILMVPIAASVVTVTRNVVGLVPFGTFMPALISVSFLDTGFLLGSLLFSLVILTTSLVNYALIRLRLLHIPRLTIILTVVVITIMAVSIIAVRLGISQGAAVSLFPMAILTLTSERFSQTILEDSWREALKRIVITYIVSCACFLVISQASVRMVVAAFPELLLANIALNLVIGSWSGIRLLEYWRFRPALRKDFATEGAV